MAKASKARSASKDIEVLAHKEARRRHIPTAELQSFVAEEEAPQPLRYPSNPDLDPQLVWRGKDGDGTEVRAIGKGEGSA